MTAENARPDRVHPSSYLHEAAIRIKGLQVRRGAKTTVLPHPDLTVDKGTVALDAVAMIEQRTEDNDASCPAVSA